MSTSLEHDQSGGRQAAAATGFAIAALNLERALQESEAWLAAQKEAFRAAVNGEPLDTSLDILARTAAAQVGGGAHCAFYVADASGSDLHPVSSMPERYPGDGDYRACCSFPVETSTGKVVGTFAMYFKEPRECTPRELALAANLTDAASIIISRAQEAEERNRAEKALHESEERFRTLANGIPNLVWMADGTGWIFWYNRRWYEYTGTTPEQMEGWGWQSVHVPELLPEVLARWKTSIATGTPFEMVLPLRGADGNFRPFLTRAEPIKNEHNQVVRWFGTNTDINEQQRIQDELRQANQDLEQFAYSASHDLQEPLRNVGIYSELLAKRYQQKLDNHGLKYLEIIRNGARRMEMLVSDLFAYTQAMKLETGVESTGAGLAFEQALANLAQAISESHAQITADPLPALRMHSTHLQLLFQNLIGNAIKYRSPLRPPVIHVGAKDQTSHWLFSVTDNGIGIEPQYRELIFGLFKRLHTSDQYSGTGIGLAICQRIVERYHGRIWVESEPGRGSSFKFTVPR